MDIVTAKSSIQFNPIQSMTLIWKLGHQKGKLGKKRKLFTTQQFANDLPTNMSSFANTTI